MADLGFKIKCEGDCERIAKVLIGWLKIKSPELQKSHTITAPNEQWATVFSEIYSDEIFNHDLADEAENNIVHITFNVNTKFPSEIDFKDLSNKELLDFLEDFKDLFEDDGFDIEENNESEDD
jgi:hypothetical protein